MNYKVITPIIYLLLITGAYAKEINSEDDDKGIEINGEFPWELIIDRGKIYGCIYDNKFYSEGSIHVEETLARKCKIGPNRDGFWAELDERELELYIESVKAQRKLENESVSLRGKPITNFEATLINAIRHNYK